MVLSWASVGGEKADVCCGLVGVAGGVGARTGGAQGADRSCVQQGRSTGDRRSLSRRLVVGGHAQNRLASGRAGGSGAALPHAVAAGAQPLAAAAFLARLAADLRRATWGKANERSPAVPAAT